MRIGTAAIADRGTIVMTGVRPMKFAETTEQTPSSEVMAVMQKDVEKFTIFLPADWLQGRTAYGGLFERRFGSSS